MRVRIGNYPKYNKKTKKYPLRKIDIKLDRWDTWNVDTTIALLVVPLLKQLHKEKNGAPFTDDADVPENLRSTACPPKKHEWDTDKNFFKRWNWIMKEMIWAFEQHTIDWEKKYHSGKMDIKWVKQPDGSSQMERGPKDTHKFDKEGAAAHQKRIDNGLRLFAKYYSSLWD